MAQAGFARTASVIVTRADVQPHHQRSMDCSWWSFQHLLATIARFDGVAKHSDAPAAHTSAHTCLNASAGAWQDEGPLAACAGRGARHNCDARGRWIGREATASAIDDQGAPTAAHWRGTRGRHVAAGGAGLVDASAPAATGTTGAAQLTQSLWSKGEGRWQPRGLSFALALQHQLRWHPSQAAHAPLYQQCEVHPWRR